MSNTPAVSIFESTFAPSDKTDAILVVDGKKLHVNKAFLSDHSEYFKTLFNSEFAGKSMPEIPIKDVNYEDFATILFCIHEASRDDAGDVGNCRFFRLDNVERLLELAERFAFPLAKFRLEIYLASFPGEYGLKVRLCHKYNLEYLHNVSFIHYDPYGDYLDHN